MRRLHSRLLCSVFALAIVLGSLVLATSVAATGFVVNEILLVNDTHVAAEFLDEDGTRQPWVELLNNGESTLSLDGWAIAPSATDPDRFVLPDIDVAAGDTVVVWLSGKDRVLPGSPLHTDFSPANGRELYLFAPSSQLVDSFTSKIPADHSMGRCAETGGPSLYYYSAPSPGAPNHYLGSVPFVVLERHVSLTVGQPLALHVWPAVDVIWSSDNPLVSVDASGVISAAVDAQAPLGAATVTATAVANAFSASVDVTIVPWKANVSHIELTPQSVADGVLASDEDGVYFSVGTALYESPGGLTDAVQVGVLPEPPSGLSRLMLTPFGTFFDVDERVYRTSDLTNWTLERQMWNTALRHMITSYWDESTQTGYVFAGEYSSQDPTNWHKLHRGIYPNGGGGTWDQPLDLASLWDWQNDPSVLDAVRHIHVAAIDPFTGDVYVATGDANEHSRILHSNDFGTNFEVLGMGSQDWRALAIWFTPEFVYWNMDTSAAQSIWRMPRSLRSPAGVWPSVTPELSSGSTQTGVHYYVTREADPGRFPVSVGEIWVESGATALDSSHAVRALDDPAYDGRELVATIDNGPHWYQGFATSEQGDLISLVATEPGFAPYRDSRSRVIGIKEGVGGVPDVQELSLVEPELNHWYGPLTQLIPKTQGPDGFVYFASRKASHERYVGRLNWYDDVGSAPLGPTPPTPPAEDCKPVPEPGAAAAWATALPMLIVIQARRRRRRLRTA